MASSSAWLYRARGCMVGGSQQTPQVSSACASVRWSLCALPAHNRERRPDAEALKLKLAVVGGEPRVASFPM